MTDYVTCSSFIQVLKSPHLKHSPSISQETPYCSLFLYGPISFPHHNSPSSIRIWLCVLWSEFPFVPFRLLLLGLVFLYSNGQNACVEWGRNHLSVEELRHAKSPLMFRSGDQMQFWDVETSRWSVSSDVSQGLEDLPGKNRWTVKETWVYCVFICSILSTTSLTPFEVLLTMIVLSVVRVLHQSSGGIMMDSRIVEKTSTESDTGGVCVSWLVVCVWPDEHDTSSSLYLGIGIFYYRDWSDALIPDAWGNT